MLSRHSKSNAFTKNLIIVVLTLVLFSVPLFVNASAIDDAQSNGCASLNQFGPFIIDSISQNNQIVQPSVEEYSAVFTVNDTQRIVVSLHTEQAFDECIYKITDTWNGYYDYSGAEIKAGISVSIVPDQYGAMSQQRETISFSLVNGNQYIAPGTFYVHEGTQKNAEMTSYHDDTIPDISFDVKYTGTPDVPIKYNMISPYYHNSEKPINVIVHGGQFSDDEQKTITIKAFDGFDEVYTKTVEKTGAELKSEAGISVELTNFTMVGPDPDNFDPAEEKGTYQIRVSVDDIEHLQWYFYSYESTNIRSAIVYPDGEVNTVDGRSGGSSAGPRDSYNKEGVNRSYVSNGKTVKIYYTLDFISQEMDIPDQAVFDYVLSKKCDNSQEIQIGNGSISGKDLKNGTLNADIKGITDENVCTYSFMLTQYNQVMLRARNEVFFWDGAGIKSASLTATEKLYNGLSSMTFLAPKDNNINIKLTGTGFNEAKKYEVYPIGDEGDYSSVSGVYTGKQLNNGEAKLTIPYLDGIKQVLLDLGVKSEDGIEYPGSSIWVTYIDINEFLSNSKRYTFDNSISAIKDVKKKTNINDYIDGLGHKKGGTVEVVNPDGKNTIGTGMKTRVKDEYGRTEMDLRTIVVGDVDGDGDITANDLARERQHLSGKRLLEGVYKIAGSASGYNEITPTDLARMRQDLSGKREMRQ